MKNILLLLLLFTGIVNGQIINFPDANFKAKLLSANASNGIAGNFLGEYCTIDINNNGEIEVTEALAIRFIIVKNPYNDSPPITDLTGIESFTNLLSLNCSSNQLTTLDVSALTNLQSLYCYSNRLTSLNLGNLTSITYLICFTNQLTELNVSNLSNITSLQCGSNLLTTLDLSGLTQLTSLGCQGNLFSTLEVAHLTTLESFSYGNSGLQVVNLHPLINLIILSHRGSGMPSEVVLDLPNLQDFSCFDDPAITSIDLSQCSSLLRANVGGNSALTYLNTKNGGHLYHSINECPNLLYVCTNDIDLSHTTSSLIGDGNNPLAHASSYCTFTPGGDYNTISGDVKFDFNNDGCDASDSNNHQIRIDINDGSSQGATYTSFNGNYTLFTQAGNFNLAPNIENPSWFNINPPTTTVEFANDNNNSATRDFCITANGIHPDVEIVITPYSPARPGYEAFYRIYIKNKGNTVLSGEVTLNFDNSKCNFVTATPNISFQNLNSVIWQYSNLMPFDTRGYQFSMNINATTDTSPVNIGDVLPFDVSILPLVGDETPADNSMHYNQTVVNSTALNLIECLEGSTVAATEIGNYLHYNVNFENMGNVNAENVVVRSIIDTDKFDVNSLQVLGNSHPMEVRLNGNILECIFQNINLPPTNTNPIGGHGNVLFKIRTNATLNEGDQVLNNAEIHFDYNEPVGTNDAITTFGLLNNNQFVKDDSVNIYPNPTKNRITVSAKNKLKSVMLFDVQGRLLQTILEYNKTTTLDISNQANGIYFLKVNTEVGSSVEKIVKEN